MSFTNLYYYPQIQCTAHNDQSPFFNCEFNGKDASWIEKEIEKICFLNIKSIFSKSDSYKNKDSSEVGFTYRFKRPVRCTILGTNDKCLTVKCTASFQQFL